MCLYERWKRPLTVSALKPTDAISSPVLEFVHWRLPPVQESGRMYLPRVKSLIFRTRLSSTVHAFACQLHRVDPYPPIPVYRNPLEFRAMSCHSRALK